MADEVSPYKIFQKWLFDGDIKSPIPDREVLLKYNSPITATYLMGIFVKNGKLNHYLDTYMNNIGLRYIDKEELFLFIKKAVLDFKIQKNTLHYISYPKKKTKLYDKLRSRISFLKNDDLSLLCDIIEKSDDADKVYSSFGIDDAKKEKIKATKKDPKGSDKSLQRYLSDHFKMIKIQ